MDVRTMMVVPNQSSFEALVDPVYMKNIVMNLTIL